MKKQLEQELKALNAKLQKQLAAKNRELEIECALEHVRAVAMGMRTPDDLLNICKVLFEELTALGFGDLRNAIIQTYPEENNYFIDYDYSDFTKGNINHIPYSGNPILEKFVEDIRKTKDAFTEIVITGNELKKWKTFRDANNEAPDERLSNTPCLYYYIYSVGDASIGISTFNAIAAEKLEVLKRFRNVFDLAYRRYLDIQQAEAQARESQIQLALERIRARTMAMQQSDELADISLELFKQIQSLGVAVWHCAFRIYNEEDQDSLTEWSTNIGGVYPRYQIPNKGIFRKYHDAGMAGESLHVEVFDEDRCADHYAWLCTLPEVGDRLLALKAHGVSFPTSQIEHVAFFKHGYLIFITYDPAPEAHDIFRRFAKVFEQTYIRFLDLQSAEDQVRESQIQLALERVRARTMAMQKSEELAETVFVLFQQFKELGENPDQATIGIVNEEEKVIEYWVTMYGNQDNKVYKFSIDEPNVTHKIYKGWKANKKSLVIDLSGKELHDFATYRQKMGGAKLNKNEKRRIINVAFFSKGLINVQSAEERSEESIRLLERFAGVFDGTYTRFLDLKQAEELAQESQIQLALERVRARTMAMQKSEELHEVIQLVFDQLQQLKFDIDVANFALNYKETDGFDLLLAVPHGTYPMKIHVPYFQHPIFDHFNKAKEKGGLLTDTFSKDEKDSFFEHFFKYVPSTPEETKASILSRPGFVRSTALMKNTALTIHNYDGIPYSEAENNTLLRFGQAFDQTYTRFKDLERAEAQAREGQIQLGLERVRAAAMAMHDSTGVGNATALVFSELYKLGINTIRCGVCIIDGPAKEIEVWSASQLEGKVNRGAGKLDMTAHPLWVYLLDAWLKKIPSFSYELKGKELTDYYKAIRNAPDYKAPEGQKTAELPGEKQYCNCYIFNEGCLFTFTTEPFSPETNQVLEKFAAVFGLTYRRYLDLAKAEAQAREAQIEAALERVRSKAMAMRSSSDLNETANTVFIEMRKLGVDLVRCGLGLMRKEDHISTIHAATNSAEGGSLEVLGNINMDIHPVFVGIYDHWRKNEDYFPVLEGKSLRAYYEKLHESGIAVPEWKSGKKQYGYFLQFTYGSLYAWSGKQESEATIKTLKRFTSVIGLTYTRYIELQNAEINTKEAIKQASLDRVRAEIASMRKRSDLERITPLIWEELTVLGIPFIRCGVFIMDEEQKLIHTFLSTPDGKAIGAFHVPFDTSGNFEKMVYSWRHNVPYIDHWQEEAFSQFADTLVKQGAIATKAQYMRTLPHEGIHLNFLPFLQGMLYVGNKEPISEENRDLVQAVAEAFSTAYARYEDFNKLEAAKQQVDNTLAQLKLTQNKLIQSEKMASLGELTAGIAHEIQNPLNFVNNFSEVSAELIDEMDDELDKGDIEEAKAIASDIRENLQKIRHHGGRADGIVKGMLQHSRASSNVKEPTDINKLADEYLHLAYHGLRAKDKSFNAELIMHFDEKLPKPEVVPQDIGRVILNMLNNAFYATQQKAKMLNGLYKPEVTMTTCAENGQVIIKVKDNGNGVPQAIKDKIMQPFFTTKPTGEGTGLGLSLSYDIVVKGHGGKIDVETKENEFTEFTVSLPIN